MSYQMFQKYGMMFSCDEAVLDASLEALLPKPVVRVLEIGTYSGHTARGMKKFLEAHGSSIQYWGIEPSKLIPVQDPFPGATVIKGRSDESFHLVPDDLDFIFVDGDHCRNAVILDVFNYYTKVVPGGFMVFHDTNPAGQGKGYEYDGPHIPQFGVAVAEAFQLIGWPWAPWTLFMEKYPPDHHQNGTQSYRNGPKP